MSAIPLKVLLVEDSEDDARLVLLALRRGGFRVEHERVDGAAAMRAALARGGWDAVISDYNMPGFSGLEALGILKAAGLDIPFILVSGTVGEEIAASAMKAGANDYVMKKSLTRFAPSLERELKEAAGRAQHRRTGAELRMLVECSPLAIYTRDREGLLTSWNPAAEKLYGWSASEVLGKPLPSVPAQERAESDGLRARLLAGETFIRHDTERRRRDGSTVHIDAFLGPLRDATGETTGIIAVVADITERKQAEQKIRRLSRVHAMLSGINSLIVRVQDRDELFREACRIAVEAGGFKMAWVGILDRGARTVVPVASVGTEAGFEEIARHRFTLDADPAEGRSLTVQAVLERRPVVSNDIRGDTRVLFRRERTQRGIASMAILPLLVSGECAGVLALYAGEAGFFDGEEMKLLADLAGDIAFAVQHLETAQRLEYLAHHDELTGMPNRALLLDRMAQQLPAALRAGARNALVLVDVNRFQEVNDSLGRAAGDALLREAGARLRAGVRESDTVARIGPNRFAVFAADLKKEADIGMVLQDKVLGAFAAPFALAGQAVTVSVRAGIALHPGDASNAEDLVRNAEAALGRARSENERYVFYAPELNARVAERLALGSRLAGALERRELVLHYQPKIALASGGAVSVEALMRWQDPEQGLVSPAAFIPLLEESGLIVEAGKWAIAEALAAQARWARQGVRVPRVAVNVSAVQLRRKDFVASVMRILQDAGDAAGALELEITESLLMQDFDASVRKLSILRGRGVTVALDDFGTGFCSLNYLARLPIDCVKIDRSFVTGIASDARGAAIVQSVISLAHQLQLKIVAEGIETAEQAALLARLGCDEGQGYLYSKPVPAERIGAFFAARERAGETFLFTVGHPKDTVHG